MIAPLSPEDAVPESAPAAESVLVYCCVCGAPVPEEDNFCEECGASLKPTTAPSELPCPKCGAGAGQIDAEGFCSSCGIRREQRGRDRLEVAVSAELAGSSDRGHRHHRNEDFFAVQAFGERRGYALVVCDGVSSTRDPDRASEAACVAACSSLVAAFEAGAVADADLIEALKAGQRAVESIPSGSGPESERPATTIVAAAVRDNLVSIAWLGDSRAYWIGVDGVQRLTQDHSWLADAVTASGASAEKPEPELAHAITRWLGAGAEGFEPGLAHFVISGQGLLLLCSDGLWNYAADATISRLASECEGPALSICRDLVAFALDQGGNDNVTALVVSLAPIEEHRVAAEAMNPAPAMGTESNDSVQG